MAATCLPFSAARMSEPDDRAVAAGAVERLLDAEHRRVLGRLRDEGLDRGGERVVGVVHQDVALAQHGEELGRIVRGRGQAGRRHRRPGLAVEVGTVEGVDAPQPAQVEGRADAVDAVARRPRARWPAGRPARRSCRPRPRGASALPKRRRRSSISIATSRSSASSSSRARSALRVTRKAWCSPDRHAGEERVEVGRDDLLEGHEALAVGHDDEARQHRRDLDPGDAALRRSTGPAPRPRG